MSKPSDAQSPDAQSSAARPTAGEPVTFTISGLAYLTVLLTVIVVIMMIGISPAWLGWTIVLPFVQAWWIHRLKTVVGPDGIRAVHTFGETSIGWDEVDGLQFDKGGAVSAVRKNGSSVRLPAVGFRDTPVLHVASGGRIPDPYAAARDARLASGD